ncbi:MAG: 2-dehydropantoate 2-reductase [Pseudomonadota bacterium]
MDRVSMTPANDADESQPPWYVLGAGALGTLIAGQLQEKKQPFSLLSRDPADRRRRLKVADRWLELSMHPLTEIGSGEIRGLIVATKAGDCANALAQIADGLAVDAEVVVMANGLGFEQQLATVLSGRLLMRGVSTSAAYRQGKEDVIMASQGETYLGRIGEIENTDQNLEHPSPFVESTLCELKNWSWKPQIEQRIHRKFCINCVINPLTALLRCKNGMLVQRDDYRVQTEGLASEVEAVARTLELWSGEEALISAVTTVCHSTATNLSSTLQDILAGRRSELPFLTGELLKRANKIGVAIPKSADLLNELLR